MNNNVNITKYTNLYKHVGQYLATGAHASSNEHLRMGTASTEIGTGVGKLWVRHQEQAPQGQWPSKKRNHLQQLPTYVWSMKIMVWEWFVDQLLCRSRCCPILFPCSAILHLQLDS